MRKCGLCGAVDIPFRVEWEWWRDGKPTHARCARLADLAAVVHGLQQAWEVIAANPALEPVCAMGLIGYGTRPPVAGPVPMELSYVQCGSSAALEEALGSLLLDLQKGKKHDA